MKKSEVRQIIREIIQEDARSRNFAEKMYDMEDELKKGNKRAWKKFDSDIGDFFSEEDAQDWEDAYRKNINSCFAFEEELKSMIDAL